MDTRETGEEHPKHCMLTDEVTGPIAVRPRCEMVSEAQFVIELEENTVFPKCDMEANETNGKEVENNAVRPKSDMDAERGERSPSQKRHGCGSEVAKKTSINMKLEQQQQKKKLEVSDEVSKEGVEIRRLVEERRNNSKGEKIISNQIRTVEKKSGLTTSKLKYF